MTTVQEVWNEVAAKNTLPEIVVTELPPQKRELTPDQIYSRSIYGMSNRQLAGHLRHQKKKVANRTPRLNEAFAIVLSTVFESTKSSGVGGKLEPYLR